MSANTSNPPNVVQDTEEPDNAPQAVMGTQALILLFTFTGLFVGAILREVSKKTRIPYTPLLLAVGLFVSVSMDKFAIVGQATHVALLLQPLGVLMIFLPTLIFESAFGADWYMVKKVIRNVCLLAGPGVLYSTILLALLLKVILQYEDDELSWLGALVIGSILSTTDPIAIGPLVKDLGTPVKFNLLIEGESLVNNGMSLVFFTLFLGMIKGASSDTGEVALRFVQLAGGGPLFGAIIGIIASLWLKRITRDNTLTVTITFVACYLLFFAAENLLHVSGLLALVSLGLFMSAYGKATIDTDAERALHAVWGWVQYASETLIFLLTGLFLGYNVLFKAENSTIEGSDWIRMIFFYIFMIGARVVMIGTFYPFLQRHGYGINGKEFVILVWGGLKGVIGLCLALIVATDDSLPKRMRDLVILYTAGMAVLTLLINNTTCSWLLSRMEMVMEPEIKNRLERNLIADMIQRSQEKEEKLKLDSFFSLTDWATVKKLVGNDEMMKDYDKSANGPLETEMEDLTKMMQKKSAYQFFKDDDIFQETRFRLLRIMKGIYWEKYEQGLLSGEAAKLLVKGVNVCLDATEQPIDLWSFIYEYFTSFRLIKFFMKIKDFFLFGRLFRSYITSHMSFVYEVTTAFVEVCGEILDAEDIVPLSKHHIQTIMEEIDKNRSDAENYILDLQGNFLEIVKDIQIRRAANQILGQQKHFLEEMLHSGQIEEKEYFAIRRKVDRKINSLDNFKIEWQYPSFAEFVREFPIFCDLSIEDMKTLVNESKQQAFHKGDYLYEKGQPCSGVFFVTKGRVIESIDAKKTFSSGIGSILSFANMVNEQRKAVVTCEAFSDVQTTFVPFEKLEQIIKSNPQFEEKVYKNALFNFMQALQGKANSLKIDENKVKEILRKSKLRTFSEGVKFTLMNGGFFFSGAVTRENSMGERVKIENFSIIWPGKFELSTNGISKILVFEREIRDIFDTYEEENVPKSRDLNCIKHI